jgi:branched-chain amino acid transport system ATP-binding protein
MLLEVKDVVVHYGRAEALKGISLEVEEGSVIAMIGSNGAGKTTTLKTICGLKRPSSGKILLEGKRIDRIPVYDVVRLGIAHIPEGRMIFGSMTVFDNLKVGAYLRKDKEGIARDIENIYEHFPVLKRRRTQAAGRLSGGEQQMLAIGRALMAKPRLLLMDEPSMGLSPLMVKEVGRIIADINKSGITIMLVEQNARMALRLATRAYVIELGRISSEGDARDLANDDRVKRAYLGG